MSYIQNRSRLESSKRITNLLSLLFMLTDPWWNAAVEDQCVDRIHRIGQSAKKIYVRKFFVENTIEERILELQKRKKRIARAVLCGNCPTGGDGIEARPSIDDFKILFNA